MAAKQQDDHLPSEIYNLNGEFDDIIKQQEGLISNPPAVVSQQDKKDEQQISLQYVDGPKKKAS